MYQYMEFTRKCQMDLKIYGDNLVSKRKAPAAPGRSTPAAFTHRRRLKLNTMIAGFLTAVCMVSLF